MDPGDDDYEVLDSGGPGDPAERRGDGALPVLDLGDRTGEPDDAPPGRDGRKPMPTWQRCAAVGVAFVVGALVGAYVWHARSEAAALAADASRVDLVAGRVDVSISYDQFGLPEEPNRLFVDLHNAGARDVDIRDIRLLSWQLAGPEASRTRTIPAGEWMVFTLAGEVSCTGTVPQHLDVDVRTDAGDSSVVVPLPPADVLQAPHRADLTDVYGAMCPDIASRRIVAAAINARRNPVDPRILEMGVRLLVPGVMTQLTGVQASAAGFHGAPTALPVAAGGDRPSVTISVDWRIDNCAETAELSDVTLDVAVSGAEQQSVPVPLPGEAVAALARFAAEECGV